MHSASYFAGTAYCQQVGIAADPAQCIADLQTQLTEAIRTTDAAFPTNTSLTITNGEPRLRRLEPIFPPNPKSQKSAK